MTRKRSLADFETQDLLAAVDELDNIRGILADGPNLEPPQLRTDLLKLDRLAMRVCHEGADGDAELMELAIDLEDQVEEIRDSTERVLAVLARLTEGPFADDEDPDTEW